MTNNDILRRLRYTFNFNDKKMVAIFALAEQTVTREQICCWLKKDGDEKAANCPDTQLAAFLNGFINEKRGKREGEQPKSEKSLNNNIVLNKLKIALTLRAEDVIELLQLANLRINKSELSAFFRKPDHKNYRQCKDQILRNFLQGIQERYYVERTKKINFDVNNNEQKDPIKAVDATNENQVGRANNKPNTSKLFKHKKMVSSTNVYVNPKATPTQKTETKSKTQRKTLKLRPEDIYKK